MTADSAAPVSGADIPVASHSWGGEFRALLSLAWPLVLAQLAQNALFTTDVIMLGWLGPKFLAAAALANALFVAMQLFGIGVAGAVAPLVAQALGARDFRLVRHTLRQGMWVGLVTAGVLVPICWNIAPIYHALGQDPELTAMAERFVHFGVWLMFPALQIIVFRSFLAAHGATRVILFITLAGVVVNALCDYALIFGNWGFPRLELAGSAIATTLVNFVMLALIVLYALLHRKFRRYHPFHRFFVPDWPRFFAVWRIGIPIGLMSLAEVLLFTSASLLQGWIGQDSVAAHAIALQLSSISFMVPLAIAQAATVRVGIAFGERNHDGIGKAGWSAQAVTLIFMGTMAVLFLTIPTQLASLFLDPANPANTHAVALAASFLMVGGLFQLFDGTQATMGAALRGLGDTNLPLVVALVGYWLVGAPVAYLCGFTFGLEGVGVWIGLAAGLASVAIVLTIRFAMRERLGLTRRAIV